MNLFKCDYSHNGEKRELLTNSLCKGYEFTAFEGIVSLAGLKQFVSKIFTVPNSFKWIQYSPVSLTPKRKDISCGSKCDSLNAKSGRDQFYYQRGKEQPHFFNVFN